MKKWIVRLLIAFVALAIIAGVFAVVFLDQIVKRGVETAGPIITKVDVKLDKASVSFSGSAALKGLFVGNPEGYKTDSAIKVGDISVSLQPGSLLSDKIVINSVNVKAPEITLEGGLRDNNLTKILDNVNSVAGGSSSNTNQPAAAKPGKKIQITDLVLSNTKVRISSPLLGGKMETITIPDIHMTNLGTGSDGLTPAELTQKILDEVIKDVVPAVASNVSALGKDAVGAAKNLTKDPNKTVNKITSGFKGLFKK